MNDVHDDEIETSISKIFEATTQDEKYKYHRVEVLEHVCQTWIRRSFWNIDDLNFIEEFDTIVARCIEVGAVEGIYIESC